MRNLFRRTLLYRMLAAILSNQERIMSALDDLKTAVENVVTEINSAVEFIKNHPTTNNDPAMADMATRLQAAADALHIVDQEPPPAP